MRISKELFDLLTTAKEYSVITDGAFDITYASVGYMYDFRKHIHPDESRIGKALPAVNFRHVLLDSKNQTVQFSQKGVRIDLGGIAKGYSVDRGIEILKARGFTRAYVSAGGDSRIIGDRFGKPWMVGIRDPRKGAGEVITRIPLVDAAISTSGDYERYFEENGVRYHHIIDPRTGHSASKVRSATIIGPYATRTDGLSKTAFVLGPEKAMEIYNRIDDIDAIIVRAVLRGERGALPPHHRSAHRPFREQGAQRHHHRTVRHPHRRLVQDRVRAGSGKSHGDLQSHRRHRRDHRQARRHCDLFQGNRARAEHCSREVKRSASAPAEL